MRHIVTIGCSAGGIQALKNLLLHWPYQLDLSVLIVQHLDRKTRQFATLLNSFSKWPVAEAMHCQKIQRQHIYFAPPDYHLLVERNGLLSLSYEEKVCFTRPSIDVLFCTAAQAYKHQVIGLLLTGANHDGSEGCRQIKACGGMTIAQNPQEAQISVMPQAAIDAGVVDHVLTLAEMIVYLNTLERVQL